MKLKNEEELQTMLGSALRVYSYAVANGSKLYPYLPLLEQESVDVTVTLKDDGSVVVSPYVAPLPLVDVPEPVGSVFFNPTENLEPVVEVAEEPLITVKPKRQRRKKA